mmetsp:Transcript_10023/g.42134  ORF Transcript_10023/g.42134 Transcript_10023/m.42134 type:complete len:520 (-) Transcript_10023:942-2501(-)
MVEKVRPHKQNSFRQTSEFANIARTVGEVDDFVMQEFLTDIIDGGVGPAVLGAGDGLSPGGSLQLQPSFGVAHFNAPLMQTNPFPAMDMEAPPGAQVPVGAAPLGLPADPAAFARGAADPPKKPAKGKKTRRASRVSNNGSDDDEAADAEQRRKRQREANLQAQRRCRERHRTHVTNLEAEVDALRAKADAATAESARLQASLQRSLMGLEECQQRWQTMEQERLDMRQMKEYAEAKLAQTLEALRECASKNGVLVDELRRSASPASSAGQVPPIAPPPGDCAPCAALQRDAAEVELKAKAGEASESEMKRIALRLSRQFRTYLVDGNACSSAQAFTSPESDVSTAGPGQTRSVFKRAHKVARSLDLSDAQRAQIVQLWKAHSGKLHALFERRKKLTADALMLQGSSPVATLVDFLSIGSGTLSGVRNEEELAEQGGSMTLTGFAQHACRLQGVISELRENIGAEQKQNFVLVSEVVDDVLTPMQTCTICATWGTECPDMLAISRAVTVQTMEENGAAR